jgi:heme exporter protein A
MLEAKEISCIRGNRELFCHLSFRVDKGTALRIHGANGAGKTSLLRMVAGLSPVTQGRISWDGQALTQMVTSIMPNWCLSVTPMRSRRT